MHLVKYLTKDKKIIGEIWEPKSDIGGTVIAGVVILAVIGVSLAYYNLNLKR